MAIAPGIRIEETASLTFPASMSTTAVPVFIGNFTVKPAADPKDGDKKVAKGRSGTCIAVQNWLDFTMKFRPRPIGPAERLTVTLTRTGPALEDEHDTVDREMDADAYTITCGRYPVDDAWFAIQLYFMNGGGNCYILPLTDAQLSGHRLDQLPAEIRNYPEISLLVCPQRDDSLKQHKSSLYQALDPLLRLDRGHFLLVDSPDGQAWNNTRIDQTAVYYPPLITMFRAPRPADAEVKLLGHPDGRKEHLSDLAPTNKQPPSKLYERIVAAIEAQAPQLILPPSAAVAGTYVVNDRKRGVWKAPAYIPLQGVESVEKALSDEEHGTRNENGTNVIRTFGTRGTRGTFVCGIRTRASAEGGWQYIGTRRLANMAARDIQRLIGFAVNEPHSELTWGRVKAVIDGYLNKLWRRGALAGDTPSKAYFVQVGQDVTMTEADIIAGTLKVKVGIAPRQPAEFLTLQFSQGG
ncbi:phage tail sheath C-terminal domain-containing protein [Burkholderia ubonensis]|uniref:phage tail sheath C-terminal domain-containing protein n=1 Tax=Burkholderia ubonensis TaxID=101571 RepID=UPI000AAAF6ED|nr:phage tail sheath C-terminal domain-containing protein [Burkholderia ubonensis]